MPLFESVSLLFQIRLFIGFLVVSLRASGFLIGVNFEGARWGQSFITDIPINRFATNSPVIKIIKAGTIVWIVIDNVRIVIIIAANDHLAVHSIALATLFLLISNSFPSTTVLN